MWPQIDAVQEDINVDNFGKRSAMAGLSQVPFENRLLGDSRSKATFNCPFSATTQGSDDHETGVLAIIQWQCFCNGRSNEFYQSRCRVECWHCALGNSRAKKLMRPGQQGQRSTSKARAEAERRYARTSIIYEKFEVIEQTPGLGKARELGGPSILLLETVGEVNVCMRQGR